MLCYWWEYVYYHDAPRFTKMCASVRTFPARARQNVLRYSDGRAGIKRWLHCNGLYISVLLLVGSKFWGSFVC